MEESIGMDIAPKKSSLGKSKKRVSRKGIFQTAPSDGGSRVTTTGKVRCYRCDAHIKGNVDASRRCQCWLCTLRVCVNKKVVEMSAEVDRKCMATFNALPRHMKAKYQTGR